MIVAARLAVFAGVVFYAVAAMFALRGGLSSALSPRERQEQGQGAAAHVAALSLQVIGLILFFASSGRLPATAFDALALASVVASATALWLARHGRSASCRTPLLSFAACAGASILAVDAESWGGPHPVATAAFVAIHGVALGWAGSLVAVALRRALRDDRLGPLAALAVLLAGCFALLRAWPASTAHVPLVAMDAGGQPLLVDVAFRLRDGSASYVRALPVHVAYGLADGAVSAAAWGLGIGFVLLAIATWVPGRVYRAAAALGLAVAGLATCGLLLVLAWVAAGLAAVDVDAASMMNWLERDVLPWARPPVTIAELGRIEVAEASVSAQSAPATWALLAFVGPAVLIAIGARLRTLFTVRDARRSVRERAVFDRTEAALGMAALASWVVSFVAALVWQEWSVGAGWGYDPGLYTRLAALVGLAAWWMGRVRLDARSMWPAASLLVFALAVIHLVFGSLLGWTMPTLLPL